MTSSSGAVIARMCCLPCHGNTYDSSRGSVIVRWLSVQRAVCLTTHSRAIFSKVSSVERAEARCAFFSVLGSAPLATCLRASSCPSRASLSVTSG